MKYANFCNAGRVGVNIGDYLQFMVVDFLYSRMGVPPDEIVYLGFKELASYNGEELIFPFCYSIIDFVSDGKISISPKIKPVFLAVTLSTVDKFMDVDQFLEDKYNCAYLIEHGPVGCRDEVTYNMLVEHCIPAYINGCMTAILPKYTDCPGDKVLFVDAPKALLPYIPDSIFKNCTFSTQQYYFKPSDVEDYQTMFAFVANKYRNYQETARLAITSRLHVALPLTAFGIPVVLAKDNVDGRFSFIERYLPVYGKEHYGEINWTPGVLDLEQIKNRLITHALGRIQNNISDPELRGMEQALTRWFQMRTVRNEYQLSYAATHTNGRRFDVYARKYWNADQPIKYAFWGVSENNLDYWKSHVETRYPRAELTMLFDSFREGRLLGIPYQRPEKIIQYSDIHVIVCSVGAAQAAQKLFDLWKLNPKRYCIVSDCFIQKDDVRRDRLDIHPNNSI